MASRAALILNLILRIISSYFMKKKQARRRSLWSSEVFRLREIYGHGRMLREQLRDNEGIFFEYTRMTMRQFEDLLKIVGPELKRKDTRMRKAVVAYDRLALCLRFLASGDSFRSLSLGFRVGKSTVHKIIIETCKAIVKTLKPKYMKMPTSHEEWDAIATGFQYRWNFPQCLGAIDGKHVAIRKPYNSGSTFFNYKNFHSIVLMASCDAQYCFTFVHVGDYGRFSDGGIFRDCHLAKKIADVQFLPPQRKLPSSSKTVPYVFVADEAFPLQHQLMRPFPGNFLEKEKRIYNYRLSRARRCIENAFGILAARWRVLLTTIGLLPDNASLVTMACCCLHNYLMKTQMPYANRTYCPTSYADRPGENGTIIDGTVRQDNSLISISNVGGERSISAANIRNLYCEYFNNEGSVPWQDSKL